MGQALYRKYRSKSLDEIIGQEHITDTLKHALASGRISHAYLFTGPRGVGKTSVARILAHAINNLPYTDEDNHLDIIEIDAASNRRIDEIRDLRDKVYIAPAAAKYKVYIIDEVHMLTKEAFNALLKTLEEPPAHVVFILATTEAHKLPATIVSRTQRYVFRPVEPAKVVAHLKDIAKQEKIKVNDAALELIAKHGEGSFRDSISLLDQAANHNQSIDLAVVQDMLGIAPAEAMADLIKAISAGDKLAIIKQLSELYNRGYSANQLAVQLGQDLRQALIDNQAILPETVMLDLLGRLIEIPASASPDQLMEITLLQAALSPVASPVATKATSVEPSVTTSQPMTRKPKPAPAAETDSAPFDVTTWPAVLEALKHRYSTLYSIAKLARPEVIDGRLQLSVDFAFHQKRLHEAKNQEAIALVIKEITGQSGAFKCIVETGRSKPVPTAVTPKPNSVSTVSNIFGGGEVIS